MSNDFPVNEVGIFVGCGTSKEAGYPLTWELTKSVFEEMDAGNISLVEEILKAESLTLSIEDGSPDIETINDLVMKISIKSQDTKYQNLEKEILRLINLNFDRITSHNLEYHRSLISSIKNRSHGISSDFWVFTTNYDLLFEEAASFEKVQIENGFIGTTLRYFDINSLLLKSGTVKAKSFHEKKECVLRLVKLHGSLSWHQLDGNFYEGNINNGSKVLILPSRNKVMDTLKSPYDSLFTLSSQILGNKCKYLVCIGHSFRDDHINKNLILPKINSGSLKVIALLKDVTPEVEELSKSPCFSYISENKSRIAGHDYELKTDIWKFSSFINFIKNSKA